MGYILKRLGFVALLIGLALGVHQLKRWARAQEHAPIPSVAAAVPLAPDVPVPEAGDANASEYARLAYVQGFQSAQGAWNNRRAAQLPVLPATTPDVMAEPGTPSLVARLTSGADFVGTKTDTQRAQNGLDFALHVTSYRPRDGAVRGVIVWPQYHARHVFAGWLTDTSLRFREVKRLQRGDCPLGLCYNLTWEPAQQQLRGRCTSLFFSDGHLPAALAALQPDSLPLDIDPSHEQAAWPPLEDNVNLAAEHNPFAPGAGTNAMGQLPGDITLLLTPLANGAQAIAAKTRPLVQALAQGRLFRGACIYGRFRFRAVTFEAATGAFEGRVQWTEVLPGPGYIDQVTGFTPFYQSQPQNTVHKVVGRLSRAQNLEFTEAFVGYECRYQLALTEAGHLEGRVWIIAQYHAAPDQMSMPVQMQIEAAAP